MTCFDVPAGTGLRITGPARVVVERGRMVIGGVEAGPEAREAVIRSTRGVTFYSLEESRVCVEAGSGGGASIVSDREAFSVALEWLRIIDELSSMGVRRVVVVGPVESGKSTFSLWLYNRLRLCFIEADVGQNELGLPGMIAAAVHRGALTVTPSDLVADHAWFAGHVSAEKVFPLIVRGVRRASSTCSNGFVVDTDGYVQDLGVFQKIALAEAVEADAVVYTSESLGRRLRGVADVVIGVKPPPLVRERNRVDRRVFRETAFARLFADTVAWKIMLDDVAIVNLEDCRVVEEGGTIARRGAVVLECESGAYVLAQKPPREPGYQWLPKGWERGILAGLDAGSWGEIPALVDAIDFTRGVAVLRVPKVYAGYVEKPRYAILGFVRLGEGFVEAEKLSPGLYPAIARQRRRRSW